MTHMMSSPGLLIARMVFLILVMGGVLIAVRAVGGRQVKSDHPD